MTTRFFSHTLAPWRTGIFSLLLAICVATAAGADMPALRNEKKVWNYIASEPFRTLQTDRRCHERNRYRVYLIDNFEQRIHLVPEVLTSHGEIDFAPPVTPQHVFAEWHQRPARSTACRIDTQTVLTAGQYQALQHLCPAELTREVTQTYVWLNAPGKAPVFEFTPACRNRGVNSGTSVIPPHKLKELLPPKRVRKSHATGGGHTKTADG